MKMNEKEGTMAHELASGLCLTELWQLSLSEEINLALNLLGFNAHGKLLHTWNKRWISTGSQCGNYNKMC